MDGCRDTGSNIGRGRLLGGWTGKHRRSREEVARGLCWVPDGQWTREIRKQFASSRGYPVPACGVGMPHERLTGTIHLCLGWYRPGVRSTAAGHAEFVAVMAGAVQDGVSALRLTPRRRKTDHPAPRPDLEDAP